MKVMEPRNQSNSRVVPEIRECNGLFSRGICVTGDCDFMQRGNGAANAMQCF